MHIHTHDSLSILIGPEERLNIRMACEVNANANLPTCRLPCLHVFTHSDSSVFKSTYISVYASSIGGGGVKQAGKK